MAVTSRSPAGKVDSGAARPRPEVSGLVPAAEMVAVEEVMHEALADDDATPARDAARYHLSTGGRRLRARLALASGKAWHAPAAHRIAAAAACELLHNASLVHDDLSDGDRFRRGRATVWHREGRDIALCTGDLLLTAAFEVAGDIDESSASQTLLRQLARHTRRVIGGQSLELAAQRDAAAPSVRDYERATRAKTAPLLELPLTTGCMLGGVAVAQARILSPLAEAIGLAYQIADDLDDTAGILTEGQGCALHPFHALRHHRPPGEKTRTTADATRRRCLLHARAALARGKRLARQLPEPLRSELLLVMRELADKLTAQERADWTGTGA